MLTTSPPTPRCAILVEVNEKAAPLTLNRKSRPVRASPPRPPRRPTPGRISFPAVPSLSPRAHRQPAAAAPSHFPRGADVMCCSVGGQGFFPFGRDAAEILTRQLILELTCIVTSLLGTGFCSGSAGGMNA